MCIQGRKKFVNVKNNICLFASVIAFAVTSTATFGAIVPFTEGFDNDAANWFNSGGTAVSDYVPAGGPDGTGFLTGSLDLSNTVDGDTPVLFRGEQIFGSSGGAFEGNYLAEGITELSAMVRHDAPAPLNFFTRFSRGLSNAPGAIAVEFVPVFPNVWTEISFAIDPVNPQFISFEFSDFTGVFSSIGNIQIGAAINPGTAGLPATVQFDLDQVSIVPEPTAGALLLTVGALVARRHRRNGTIFGR